MTNVTAGAYADAPLFLFHLLEYLDVDYEIDVDDINRRWAEASSVDVWSQLILKQNREGVELVTEAPKTGIWRLDDAGRISFGRWANDWHSLHDEAEAFYLRVLAPGDYRYPGADLGVLVARSRMQTEDNRLTDRALAWIDGIHAQFAGTAVPRRAGGAGRRDGVQDGVNVSVCRVSAKRSRDCSHVKPGQRYSARPSAG